MTTKSNDNDTSLLRAVSSSRAKELIGIRKDKTMATISDRKRGDSRSFTRSAEGTPKKKGRGERLIASSRPSRIVGTAFFSGDCSLSLRLASNVSSKACQFTMAFEDEVGDLSIYYGQGGLIRGAKIAPTPTTESGSVRNARKRRRVSFSEFTSYEATPVTAKHNLELSDEDREYKRTSIIFADGPMKDVVMPEGGCTMEGEIEVRPATEDTLSLVWEDDDVSFGTMVTRPGSSLTKQPRHFRKAPDGFRLQVGHKIGIAVYRTFDIDHVDAAAPLSVDLGSVYGLKHQVCIYTGSVTEVSENGKTFCHSINTFEGCSGAVTFLLDEDQDTAQGFPADLDEGVAVGIHVGGLDRDNNFGFLL